MLELLCVSSSAISNEEAVNFKLKDVTKEIVRIFEMQV